MAISPPPKADPDSEQGKWDSYYAQLPLGAEGDAIQKFNAELVSAVSAFLPTGSEVLEAGCGGGWQSLALARAGGYRLTLMDFSEKALSYARRLFERESAAAEFLAGDVLTPGRPDFDLVFNAGVLEHYAPTEQAAFLRGMASRSRRFVLVLVPNRACYWYWLWRVRASADGRWPFGKEVPEGDLTPVFTAAGLNVVGRAFLGADWTEVFINSLAEAAPELRDQILAVHRSALIPIAQKSYLAAWLATAPGGPAINLPQWPTPPQPEDNSLPEALAALADALALRLGGEQQLAELRTQLGQEQNQKQALSAQLGEARQQSFNLGSQLAEAQTYRQQLDSQWAEVQQQSRELRAHLTEAEELGQQLRSRLAEAEQQLNDLRSRLADEQQLNQGLAAQLATATQEANASERTVFDLRAQLALSQVMADSVRHQLADLLGQRNAQQAALAENSRLLVDAQQQAEAQIKVIAGQSAALAQRDQDLAWTRAELAVAQATSQHMARSKFWRLGIAYWRLRAVGIRNLKAIVPRRALKLARRVAPPPLPISLPAAVVADDAPPQAKDFYSGLTLRPSLSPAQVTEILASRPPVRAARPDIICFSIIDWSFRYQRPQQIMSQFAAHGHRVFYINLSQPLSLNGPRTFAVRPIKENIYELFLATERALELYGDVIDAPNRSALLAALEDLRRSYDITAAVGYIMIASWGALALEARRRWGWHIIYDCMDEWATFPGIGRPILEMERQVVQQADLIVVTAQRLYDKWLPYQRPLVLARNGVDLEFYQARLKPSNLLAGLPRPVIGYFGAIADWFDVDLMEFLAAQRPQYSFVLIGGVFNVNVSRLKALPNVRLLGQQPYESMPGYLYGFDVCLIPFKVNAITQATDPVKLYEYLSAGKPVVAVALAELELYRDHIYLSANREEFLGNLDAAVSEKDPQRSERRKAMAEGNTWQQRYRVIAQGLAAQARRASIIVITYNNLALSRLCLESVLRNTAHPNYEIVVVDNHSSDGTPGYLQQLASDYSQVRIILNDDNLGFARANNQALALANGDDLVLLNNDTIVPPGWLHRLLGHLRPSGIGLVGAVTNFVGNEARLDVQYTTWGEMESFARAFTWQHTGEVAEIPMLAMFCLALRRDVYDAIGPLDEQFGLGMFEDDDYTTRARRLGYQVVCALDVFVHHFGQAAFGQFIRDGSYDRLFERNRRLFEAKWQTEWVPHRHGSLRALPAPGEATLPDGAKAGPAGPPAADKAPIKRPERSSPSGRLAASRYAQLMQREKQKWGDHLLVEASGAWNAWLDHPQIARHYLERSQIDGLRWEEWVPKQLGGPAHMSLDLGCGAGDRSLAVWQAGAARYLEGVDVSDERVAEGERRRQAAGAPGNFWVGDVNQLALRENAYDLIFSCHSFHHFLELEAVMTQVTRALKPGGLFVLEEYVGPTQFQWTDLQMRLARELLGVLPEPLRRFRDGQVKVFEDRPTVEQVAAVSPFESIRSAEIPELFQRNFKVVAVRNLGGTIQHLLYNGIIHNFGPDSADASRYIRRIIEVEDNLIDSGQIPSDFRLLVGCRPDNPGRLA